MIDIHDYEFVEFKCKISNITEKIRGYKVGQHLIVSHADIARGKNWRIYRLIDGRPFLDTTFLTREDAIAAAEWLSKAYEEYFCILQDYSEIDLWQLTHLTIENGVLYRDIIERIKDMKEMTWADVQQFLH